jgi:hypothetical protein
MIKPEHAQDYSPEQTELAEQALLEVWSRLGEYHRFLVLVGGLVPRYLVDQKKAAIQNETHCGTMDVDLGISVAVADLAVLCVRCRMNCEPYKSRDSAWPYPSR